jgi:hypothetical protein
VPESTGSIPVPPRDLHSMVGLGRHASISELRYAYEQAMADAVSRGDHTHAVALSAAFDALSGVHRNQVYGSRLGGAPHAGSVPAGNSRARGSSGDGPRRAVGPRRHRDAAIVKRVVLYVVLIPVAVAIGVAVAVHHQPSRVGTPSPGHRQVIIYTTDTPATVAAAPAATYTPGAHAPSGSRYIPANTPVDGEGFVAVLCAPDPLSPPGPHNAIAIQFSRPGSVVTCANGAIPMIDK